MNNTSELNNENILMEFASELAENEMVDTHSILPKDMYDGENYKEQYQDEFNNLYDKYYDQLSNLISTAKENCENECRIVYDDQYLYFWKKWCGLCEGEKPLGAAEKFYMQLTNHNRKKLVDRADKVFDGDKNRKSCS